ncbi:hypothetical protein FLSI110296_11860 [Flavobacterium sinopsychrotolerans]|uniref:Uncharacterized protein n=1 Tax=Flavobacterium sinopsychrotolerans TaxID=604089 RepID=A0A1H8PL17_9FLAO|nr:hypothetical protein SAMN04487942_2739 [Flavobacterium sinopsychrotolerans]
MQFILVIHPYRNLLLFKFATFFNNPIQIFHYLNDIQKQNSTLKIES